MTQAIGFGAAWPSPQIDASVIACESSPRSAASHFGRASRPTASGSSGVFQNEILISGLNLPTAIKFLPNGDMLALELVKEFGGPAAAVIKHTNPCGASRGSSAGEALRSAIEVRDFARLAVSINNKIETLGKVVVAAAGFYF